MIVLVFIPSEFIIFRLHVVLLELLLLQVLEPLLLRHQQLLLLLDLLLLTSRHLSEHII